MRWLRGFHFQGGCHVQRKKGGAVSLTACGSQKTKERFESQMFVNDSDHHSVILRNINLEAAEVFFVKFLKFTGLPSLKLTLVSGRLTFIKEATFRSNILRMGCLRFRGQATAVDVGKILQERFLQSWGSGPWDETSTKKPGDLWYNRGTFALIHSSCACMWLFNKRTQNTRTSYLRDSRLDISDSCRFTLNLDFDKNQFLCTVTKIISKDMQCFALPKLISPFYFFLSIHRVKL